MYKEDDELAKWVGIIVFACFLLSQILELSK